MLFLPPRWKKPLSAHPPTRFLSRRIPAAIGILLLVGFWGARAQAQDAPIEALVEQVVGENLFLRSGTSEGINSSDILLVIDEDRGRVRGELLVHSASLNRSEVSFVDEPFPITRGTILSIRVKSDSGGLPERRSSEYQSSSPASSVSVQSPSSARKPSVSGRLSLQINGVDSRTKWMRNDEESVERRFATPTVGLRLRVSDLPGGMVLRTNLRGSYRYSSNEIVQPTRSLRVYQLSVEKSFARIPVQLRLGRFFNPYESYSGFWDGLLARYGVGGLGFGVAAGFEPKRGNEAGSTELAKYTAFVDFSRIADQYRYHSDLSLHRLHPSDGMPDYTFIGWSQRLTAYRMRFDTDLQVDRNPVDNSWSITRLHANGSLPIRSDLSLFGRYTFDHPRAYQRLFTYDRKQESIGVRYWDRRGNVSVSMISNRINGGNRTYSFVSSFRVPHTPLFELGFYGHGTLWTMNGSSVLDILAGINRTVGRVYSRASYRFNQSENINASFQTHTLSVGLNIPIGRKVYGLVNARMQRGRRYSASNVSVNLWTNF